MVDGSSGVEPASEVNEMLGALGSRVEALTVTVREITSLVRAHRGVLEGLTQAQSLAPGDPRSVSP